MLVEHHIKYKEIHGVDETVWIELGEHQRLHHGLRKEGKCNIPVDILRRVSNAAQKRTKKAKEYYKKYRQRDDAKAVQKLYRETSKSKEYHKEYFQKSKKTLKLSCTAMMNNVNLVEQLQLNVYTGHIYIHSFFCGGHGKKLLIVGENGTCYS